jgi:D-beta-D-heptose 7-phosphate kinase / D-beta-D-heptose 1-phosphate adenosyltransferase
MKMMITVVGDCLLDKEMRGRAERLSPDAPIPVVEDVSTSYRPGGAGLAATLARRDGCSVILVTALAGDAEGDRLRELLESQDIDVVDLGMSGSTPQKIRIGTGDRSLLRVDLGNGVAERIDPGWNLVPVLTQSAGVIVSDYGRGITAAPAVRSAIHSALATVPVVWDPHPRGSVPVTDVRLTTPNLAELYRSIGKCDQGLVSLAHQSERLRAKWGSAALCTTMGPRGALLVDGSTTPLVSPSPSVVAGDPCGAGDRFAVSAGRSLASGALVSEAVTTAVAEATAFVASGGLSLGGAAPGTGHLPSDVLDAAAAVRARGGTVVATGGCFDLLHAGHVALLRSAARLGDFLIVCINSDASTRRLKGPQRPFRGQNDRADVLRSIEGVDGVAVFEEDTPAEILGRLRPHLFVKGGDYAGAELPEAEVLERWGGRAVVVPYLEGRSTTAIVKEVIKRERH